MFIIEPEQSEEGVAKLIERMEGIIAENGGQVESSENLGKKRLAYKVLKNIDGFYALIYFSASHQTILELERNYKVNDSVIKYMTVRSEGPPKEVTPPTQSPEAKSPAQTENPTQTENPAQTESPVQEE